MLKFTYDQLNEFWTILSSFSYTTNTESTRNSNIILQRNQIEANTDKANKKTEELTHHSSMSFSWALKIIKNMIATQPKILEIIKKLFEI